MYILSKKSKEITKNKDKYICAMQKNVDPKQPCSLETSHSEPRGRMMLIGHWDDVSFNNRKKFTYNDDLSHDATSWGSIPFGQTITFRIPKYGDMALMEEYRRLEILDNYDREVAANKKIRDENNNY